MQHVSELLTLQERPEQMALEDPTEEMRDKGAACRELMSKTAEAWKNEMEMLCFRVMDNRI